MFLGHGWILTDLFYSSLFCLVCGYTQLSKHKPVFSTYTPEKSIKATRDNDAHNNKGADDSTEEAYQSHLSFHSGHSSLSEQTSFLILSTRVHKNLTLFLNSGKRQQHALKVNGWTNAVNVKEILHLWLLSQEAALFFCFQLLMGCLPGSSCLHSSCKNINRPLMGWLCTTSLNS